MPPSHSAHSADADFTKVNGQERRLVALDGLRGLMTIMVVLSHYFGELPHGLQPMMFGWVAVSMFFVLSGFLIGRLILDKKDHSNFFAVFYFRRFCGLVPVYLIVPALLVFTPRAWLVPVLVSVAAAAVGLRGAIYYFGLANEMSALVLLPARADVLACGLLAALALRNETIDWRRFDGALRIAPLAALIVAGAMKIYSLALFNVLGPLVVAIGCAGLLLAIVRGAPEAKRFHSKILRFFGDNSYCIYLTHIAVLGLAHGFILGGHPDIATPAQWAVTLGVLPVAIFVGWALTKTIEEPFMRFGRLMNWSAEIRGRAPQPAQAAYAPA